MKNHLFIGLGGQGGRSLSEIRKVMEQRANDVQELTSSNVKFDFLSIDSSSNVWETTKNWKYFGKDLQLAESQKISFDRLNQARALAIIPSIAPWIGDPGIVDGFVAGQSIPGANQRRRIGRLLFANNADRVKSAIQKKVADLTDAASHQCWFHIFASLAGGTGSGGIVDLVASIRNQFPNGDTEKGFPIFLNLFITHDDGAASDVGYFYQNQYAALRDLNALVCGRLMPMLLGAQGGGEVFNGGDPIANISLFSSLSDRNIRQPLETQIRIAAESCFEKIFAYASGGLDTKGRDALTAQDTVLVFPGEPSDKNLERSYRFASSGMRRWEVPTEKIREALSLDLMVSGLNQMLFNNWEEGVGFSNNLANLSERSLDSLRQALIQVVEKGSHSSSKDSMITEFRKEVEKLEKGVFNSSHDEKTIEALESKFRDYYSNRFRNVGVQACFNNMATNQQAKVQGLKQELDNLLTRLWKGAASPIGLSQIPSLLSSMSAAIQNQIAAEQDFSTLRNRLQQRCTARKHEWSKLTRLSRMFGKDESLLKAHARDLQADYTYCIENLFQGIDIEMKKDFLSEIQKLSMVYQVSITELRNIQNGAGSERDEIFKELQAMQNCDGANLYEFDMDAVQRFREQLKKQPSHQEKSAFDLRSRCVPDHLCLSRFHDDKIRGTLAQSLEVTDNDLRQSASDSIDSIHEEFVSSGLISSVLNAKLLEYLEQRFRGDDSQLIKEAKDFVSLAASSLHLDSSQIPPVTLLGSNQGVPPMPKRVMVLGIPNHPYADKIKEAFLSVIPAGQAYVTDVYKHNDDTQLRLLVMDYWMAARFSTAVQNLAAKFHSSAKQNTATNLLYYCNLDPDGEQGKRPDLLLPTPEEMKQKLEAQLWLGQSLLTPAIVADSNGVFLLGKNPEGVTTSVRVGTTLQATMSTADIPLMIKVDQHVKAALSQLSDTEWTSLRATVSAEGGRIEMTQGPTSPEFQRWMLLRSQLNALLN
jgi:hypothetical protein